MNALETIIQWAESDLNPWQADAVRRLLINEEMTPHDCDEIFLLMKHHHGLIDSLPPSLTPILPKIGDISGTGVTNSSLVLAAINCIDNVNAIPSGTTLLIGHSGATIVYGENGTGKSGFARVLKRACNARDRGEKILGNVYHPQSALPAKVDFKVIENGAEKTIHWSDGDRGIEALSKVTVFDSKCARLLLEKESELVYKPYGTHVFEDLVKLMDGFKLRLSQEMPKPTLLEIKNLRPNTRAYQVYNSVSSKTTDEELKDYESWTEEESTRLKQLIEWGRENPESAIKARIVASKGLVKKYVSLIKEIRRLSKLFSITGAQKINAAIADYAKFQQANEMARQLVNSTEFPIAGVRTTAWQELYLAAERFSTASAYKNAEFPNTGDGSRCVLCMTVLDDDAKIRMRKMREFITDETGRSLANSAVKLRKLQERFIDRSIRSDDDLSNYLIDVAAANPELAENIRKTFASLRATKNRFIQSINTNSLLTESDSICFNHDMMMSWVRSLWSEACNLEQSLNPEEAELLQAQGRELLSKQALHENLSMIKKYIGDLKIAEEYQACISSLDGKPISMKGKQMLNILCTPELQRALAAELGHISGTRLTVTLEPRVSKGVVVHEFKLTHDPKAKIKATPTEILSEGEQKAVSIAGFFAELHVANHSCPIVFDDPVTSVDHIFRGKIAKRLAKEAARRQVIVFTHDITFLHEMEKHLDANGDAGKTVLVLTRKNGVPGHVVPQRPWYALKPNQRLAVLEEKLSRLKSLHSANQDDDYNLEAAHWYNLFRETWESIVEDVILGGVVRRFHPEIKTQSVKCIDIQDADYRVIDQFMSKASEWMIGHDRSADLLAHRPPPNEIQQDLRHTQAFIKEMSVRGKAAEERRKILLTSKSSLQG